MFICKPLLISLILFLRCLNAESSCSVPGVDSFFQLTVDGPTTIANDDSGFEGIQAGEIDILLVSPVNLTSNCAGTVRGVEFCYFEASEMNEEDPVFLLLILEQIDMNFIVQDYIAIPVPSDPNCVGDEDLHCCGTFWLNDTSQFMVPESNFAFGIQSTGTSWAVALSPLGKSIYYLITEERSEFPDDVGDTFSTELLNMFTGHPIFSFVLDELSVPGTASSITSGPNSVTEEAATTEDNTTGATTEDVEGIPQTTSSGLAVSGSGLTTEFVSFSVALVVAVIIVLMVCLVIAGIVMAKRNSRSRKSISTVIVQPIDVAMPEHFSYTEYASRTEPEENRTYESIESLYDCIDDRESEVTQETEVNPDNTDDGIASSSSQAFRGALPLETRMDLDDRESEVTPKSEVTQKTEVNPDNTDDGIASSSSQAFRDALPLETRMDLDNTSDSDVRTNRDEYFQGTEVDPSIIEDGDMTNISSNQAYGMGLELREDTYENIDIERATTLTLDGSSLPVATTATESLNVVTDIPHLTDMAAGDSPSYHQSETRDPPNTTNTSSICQTKVVDFPPDPINVVCPHYTNMVNACPQHTSVVAGDSPDHSSIPVGDSPQQTMLVKDPPQQTNMARESPYHTKIVDDPPQQINMVTDSPHQTDLNQTNLFDSDYVSMAADYIKPTAIMEESIVNVKKYTPAESAAIISRLHGSGSTSRRTTSGVGLGRHSCHMTTDTSATPTYSDALNSAYSLPQLVIEV